MQYTYLNIKNVPFTPAYDDIIYIDRSESMKIERWRLEILIDDITAVLDRYDYPNMDPSNGSMFKTFMSIMNEPNVWIGFPREERSRLEQEMMRPFERNGRGGVEHPDRAYIMFVDRYEDENTIRFRAYPLTREQKAQDVLRHVLSVFKEHDALEGGRFASDIENAKPASSWDVSLAMQQARAAIARLRELKVDEESIRELLVNNQQQYELHIQSDGRFFVVPIKQAKGPQLFGREVRLSPLEKSVYLLFLNHPEGIMFSYLPDYQQELMGYYQRLMPYRRPEQMRQSVLDVTSPLSNSINEKCARIRRMFMAAVGSASVDHYCITGTRGCPKGIRLDRSLVRCDM